MTTRVEVSTHLFEYSGGERTLHADGRTVDELLHDLDRRHPGLRFRLVDEQGRLRQHIRVFLDTRLERDLSASLEGVGCVHLIGALSGG